MMFLNKISHFEDPKTKANIAYQADTGRLSKEEALEVMTNLPNYLQYPINYAVDINKVNKKNEKPKHEKPGYSY